MQHYNVCVVGLGYVGLPVALLAAEKGHSVSGFDVDSKHISMLKEGTCKFSDVSIKDKLQLHFASIKFSTDPIILDADVVIICVPTPVNHIRKPDLGPLTSASLTVASHLKKGQLVVVESTIYPGTVEEVVLPLLKNSGLTCGKDYWLAHCPERIDIGNPHYNVSTIPRVLGGVTKDCAKRAYDFYQTIIDAPITVLASIRAAEAAKVVENTFRDVNIALVNELARSFDAMNIDILEVIKGASTKPFAFLPHYPGCGVGGHCIPVDPYYLIERSRENGFHHRFLEMARTINEEMPSYTVLRAENALSSIGKKISGAKVAVLGVAYKANIDDIRESPSLVLIDILKQKGALVDVYDPYVPHVSTVRTLEHATTGKDCIIIATNHKQFYSLNTAPLAGTVLVDGRNCLDKDKMIAAGVIYRGIGR